MELKQEDFRGLPDGLEKFGRHEKLVVRNFH